MLFKFSAKRKYILPKNSNKIEENKIINKLKKITTKREEVPKRQNFYGSSKGSLKLLLENTSQKTRSSGKSLSRGKFEFHRH